MTAARYAYADPPYLGRCSYYSHHHPDGRCWNDIETHHALIARLVDEYPDGWALSASSSSLQVILSTCPSDVRIAAWVKPFASFKPNVRVAYAWEPVIVRGGRPNRSGAPWTRDFLAERISLRTGFTGTKPPRFCRWVLDLLGYMPGDQVDDLFPGTGAMGRAVELELGRLVS
jgi:hypothetical protein